MTNLKLTVDQLGSFTHWNDNPIGKMDTYHIINTLKYIVQKAEDYKTQYELYLMETVEWPMRLNEKDLKDVINMDVQEWIKTTPIWRGLTNELEVRNMLDYAKTKVNIL